MLEDSLDHLIYQRDVGWLIDSMRERLVVPEY